MRADGTRETLRVPEPNRPLAGAHHRRAMSQSPYRQKCNWLAKRTRDKRLPCRKIVPAYDSKSRHVISRAGTRHELDAEKFPLADANGFGLLRDRAYGYGRVAF